jgi:ADP-heptose:LPS heptosyltransferase
MSGSALNWPQEKYGALIAEYVKNSVVVITGTKADMAHLTEIEKKWKLHPQVRWLVDQLTTGNLLAVLSHARKVVAPSTGVVHLAASLGVETVGIYSPARVQSAIRWSPRGDKARAVSPPGGVVDTQPDPASMALIRVEDVL